MPFETGREVEKMIRRELDLPMNGAANHVHELGSTANAEPGGVDGIAELKLDARPAVHTHPVSWQNLVCPTDGNWEDPKARSEREAQTSALECAELTRPTSRAF